MICLDTNVLVRYITQDDPKQSPKVNRIMGSLPPATLLLILRIALFKLTLVLLDVTTL